MRPYTIAAKTATIVSVIKSPAPTRRDGSRSSVSLSIERSPALNENFPGMLPFDEQHADFKESSRDEACGDIPHE